MPAKKFKILLATPPARKKEKAEAVFTEGGSAFPSTGLLILAEIARQAGHDVFFRDFLNEGLEPGAVLGVIGDLRPDIVAISANPDMILSAAGLAAQVKASHAGTVTLLGGPHVTAVPVETMESCGGFDYGFIGEAENSFAEFLAAGMAEDAIRGIRGLCYRRDGAVVVNERQPFIADIDTLPLPAWDLIPDMGIYKPAVTNHRREPVFSLITSRGCSGQCLFCDRGVFGNRIRMHSAAYVLRMIRRLREQFGINELVFYDDNMVYDKSRLLEICDCLLREPEPLSWSCSARVDRVDEEMLTQMKRAGCWQISYGIESGSPEILRKMKKGITLEQVRRTAALMRKVGMSMRGYFIIGNPGETEETLRQTLALILELPLDDVQVEYLTPYPGTELYREAGRYGTMRGDWSSMNSYMMNFLPHGMTEAMLSDYFYRCYRSFYLRPRVIMHYCARLKNPLKMADLAVKYFKFKMSATRGS